MDYILSGLIIWAVVIAVSIAIFPVGLNIFLRKQVQRFKHRETEITLAMCAIVAIIAAITFLPLVTVNVNIVAAQEAIKKAVDTSNLAGGIANKIPGGVAEKIQGSVSSLVSPSNLRLITKGITLANAVLVGAAVLSSLVIAAFIVGIVMTLQEEDAEYTEAYTRKHVFEFKQDVFEELNKHGNY